MGCWLGAGPSMATASLPNWKWSLAGLGTDFMLREERARHSLNASVSDLFLQEKEQSYYKLPSLQEGTGRQV